MESHYVYYSYEEFGRGYIGCRTCDCLPEDDDYLGSYQDKTFNPTNKIILETFSTREEALQAEVNLHKFYQVDQNPHFANKSRQKTTGFYYAEKKFGEENPFYGKSHTNETKDKISQVGKENKGWVDRRRTYQGENNPFYGKTHSKEIREKLRQKTLEQLSTKGHPFKGKKHSEESKAKFRENNKGEKNPNFGKITPPEVRNKIGQSKVGRKLWNNGEQQKFSKECPGEGWILGGLKTKKEA
jgi:NUMOD3 motif